MAEMQAINARGETVDVNDPDAAFMIDPEESNGKRVRQNVQRNSGLLDRRRESAATDEATDDKVLSTASIGDADDAGDTDAGDADAGDNADGKSATRRRRS